MDEGFGRNLRTLFGDGTYMGIDERKLKSINLNDDKTVFTLEFEDGVAKFGVEGDCCSVSWIEHLEAPDSVAGREIVEVTDEAMSREDVYGDYECLQSYQTKFRLDNGETITLEYRNESNGYYGGYVVRLED